MLRYNAMFALQLWLSIYNISITYYNYDGYDLDISKKTRYLPTKQPTSFNRLYLYTIFKEAF